MNEKTELYKSEYDNLNGLENTAKNPVTKFLMAQCIPVFGGLISDVTIQGFYDAKINKIKDLLDSISNDSDISKDELDTIDFITKFESISRCIIRATNNDKIKFFKDLIIGNLKKLTSDSEMDEFADILDRLSMKDIEILSTLYKYLNDNSYNFNSTLQQYSSKWNSLKNGLSDEAGIFLSHCARLSGFGLCKEFTGGYTDYSGGVYIITEYGDKFIKSILN